MRRAMMAAALAWVGAAGICQAPPRPVDPKVLLPAARPAPAAAFCRDVVPYATAVGVGKVTAAKVTQHHKNEIWQPPSWTETVDLVMERMLYGRRPADGKKVTLRLRTTSYRGTTAPAARRAKGRVIVAWGGRGDEPAVLPHTPAVERAVLEALAPGWQRGARFLCPRCRDKDFDASVGKCTACAKKTASGAFTLCPSCASVAGRCQACKRTAGPATRGASLHLGSADPRNKGKRPPADIAINVKPGEAVSVWVWANLAKGVAAPELTCGGGANLADCRALYFVVESPGRKVPAILWPLLAPLSANAAPRPLSNAAGQADRMFVLSAKIADPAGVFKRLGRHTVRVAAGRLVSEPLTVWVKPEQAALDPAPARPPNRPDIPVPLIGPDGQTLTAMKAGKVMWKLRVSFKIGAVEEAGGTWIIRSEDRATVARVDAATGKMLSVVRH